MSSDREYAHDLDWEDPPENVIEPNHTAANYLVVGLRSFRAVNVRRSESAFFPLGHWSPEKWLLALIGEIGEAANLLKKLDRFETNSNTGKDPQTAIECYELIASELADAFTYLDLLAARLNIDLGSAVITKFNQVSERMDCPIRLDP